MLNNHNHEHNTQDVFKMITEDKDVVLKDYPKLDNIHCNGCENNCSLNSPKCGRGKHIKEMLQDKIGKK